jgi:protein-S-isoprenylcysteine O-methyltransferase Ste14
MTEPWRFVPLAGILLFFVLGLGVRSWLHTRRYGSTGFVLFRGGTPWERALAALGVVIPVALLAQATVAAIDPQAVRRVVPGSLTPALSVLGAVLLFGGTLLMFVAQLHMGASWRVGLEDRHPGALVTAGLYRYSRNPIYAFMFVSFAGVGLLLPTWWLLATVAGGVIGVRTWVVRVEEVHLVAIYGPAYRTYAARVGRFLPLVGRLR